MTFSIYLAYLIIVIRKCNDFFHSLGWIKPEWFVIVLQLSQFGTGQTPVTPPAVKWEVEVGGEHALATGEREEGNYLVKEKQGAEQSFNVNGRDHGCQQGAQPPAQ